MSRLPALALAMAVLGCGAPDPQPERTASGNPVLDAPPTPIAPTRTPLPRFDVPPPPAAGKAKVSLPLPGTVLAHGGGPLRTEVIQRFAKLCGNDGALILIPTAAEGADNASTRARLPAQWKGRVGSVTVLHTNDPKVADEESFVAPLRTADCVWFGGGAQGRLRDAYVGTRLHDALHDLLRRGGAIGGYSAGTAILSEVIIRRGNPDPVEDVGFGVVPTAILDQHFGAKQREPRLRTMLERHPDRVGYGIDEDTALLLHGREYEVIGNGVVRRCEPRQPCTSLPAGSRGAFP